MPTSSIDMFLACTVLLAAALIATASLTSTLQTGLTSSADINKNSYLQAIADHIVTSPGVPVDWGPGNTVPSDFGLAACSSQIPYQIDVDKVSRLNSLNSYFLSYGDMARAAKLNGIAFGISASQMMSIVIEPLSNSTLGEETSFSFTVLTNVGSQPVSASLSCYAVDDSYIGNLKGTTSSIGIGAIAVQIPTVQIDNAMLVVFARASFDERETSYAIYNFAEQTQQSAPSNSVLALTPLNHQLSFETNSSDLTVQNGYIFSFSYQQSLADLHGTSTCTIPTLVDPSPLVIVVCGQNSGVGLQQWVSYPQLPFSAGSSFTGTEQTVFTYTVTVNGVLYNLQVSLGSVPK